MNKSNSTNGIRFLMLGGFLGAGKTTAIGRLARAYQERGHRVAIVTNDQAADLVDTQTLRAQGFEVGEVAGACFCCNFDDLTRTVAELEQRQRPDIVLAEPVGSCTDLVATVIQPLLRLYQNKFSVAPYGVIVKPSHGRRILSNDPRAGFSPKAAYIFKKQLEEADFLIINRIDELEPQEVQQLASLLAAQSPGTPLLRISARTGEGIDSLLEMLDQRGIFGRNILELDYDIYAEGEAELGWLNSSLRLRASEEFELDKVLVELVERLKELLLAAEAETAHLKTIGLWEGFSAVANLVSSDGPVELSVPSRCRTRNAEMIVNARVAVSPEQLSQLVQQAVTDVCRLRQIEPLFGQTQSFRPGRPVPTHRYAEALGEA